MRFAINGELIRARLTKCTPNFAILFLQTKNPLEEFDGLKRKK
jgi:hypothetical protein